MKHSPCARPKASWLPHLTIVQHRVKQNRAYSREQEVKGSIVRMHRAALTLISCCCTHSSTGKVSFKKDNYVLKIKNYTLGMASRIVHALPLCPSWIVQLGQRGVAHHHCAECTVGREGPLSESWQAWCTLVPRGPVKMLHLLNPRTYALAGPDVLPARTPFKLQANLKSTVPPTAVHVQALEVVAIRLSIQKKHWACS